MHTFFLRRSWNHLARQDAFWAVLTDPDKANHGWQVDEFFATGRNDIAATLAKVHRFQPDLKKNTVLDFGCGVGRLSQALAEYFEKVVGVDISEKMLELAGRYNRQGNKVEYRHNAQPHLSLLADNRFDFVCSLITLQHMPPDLARAYIAEFARVCSPGGVILFQLPESSPPNALDERLKFSPWPPTLLRRIFRIARKRFEKHLFQLMPVMEMHGTPREVVLSWLKEHDLEVLSCHRHDVAGAGIPCYEYVARKRGPAAQSLP